MQTDDHEWDDAKAAINLTKHGVSFEEATFAFDDPDGLDDLDDPSGYNEVRRKLTAMAGDRLLVVIYTERGTRIRLISAREADPNERSDYNQSRGSGGP